MNKLVITQTKDNGLIENAPNEVVTKLYNIGKDDDINHNLVHNIIGKVLVNAAYNNLLEYVNNKFGPGLEIAATTTYINFRDSAVELVLLAHNVGDGTGVTLTSASSLPYLRDNISSWGSGWFSDNTSITSFDELGLFFVRILGTFDFSGTTNLKSVDLTNITTINHLVFNGSGIEEVNMPSLTTINGSGHFASSGVKKVISLGSITTTPAGSNWNDGMFYNCNSLTEVRLPDTLLSLGNFTFLNCTLLSTLNCNFLALTSIGKDNFFGTSLSIETLYMPLLVQVESRCTPTNTQYIYLPKLQHGCKTGYLGNNQSFSGAFTGEGWSVRKTGNILYLGDMKNLYPGDFTFCEINKIVIDNPTPPTLHNTMHDVSGTLVEYSDSDAASDPRYSKDKIFRLSGGIAIIPGTIYVPDGYVSAYTSDPDWINAIGSSDIANKIHSMAELDVVATKEQWDVLSDADKQKTLIAEYMNNRTSTV